jgi:glycosyltransferase involved in cell wall biosynthesis
LVRVSIVTPSYRSSDWLKLCLASVADQGAEVEHIVQDAGSDDGTLDWLKGDKRVKLFVEKDQGMYDAVNRGFRRSSGEILAFLNCDEQYLPGALANVANFFREHPGVDLVFGDVVFTDRDGEYLWHRKMQIPLKYHTWTCHLSTLTCGMFFRRGVYFDKNRTFNPALRDAGDAEWMLRLLRDRVTMATLSQFTSVFTQTGKNMSAAPNALRENGSLRNSAPPLIRLARPAVILHHRFRRLLGGMYSQGPFDYELYTLASPNQRVRHHVAQPRFQSQT